MKRRLCLLFVLVLLVSSAHAEAQIGEMLIRGNTAVVRVSDAALCDYAEVLYPAKVPGDDELAFDDSKIDVDDAWLRETLTDGEYAAFTGDYAPVTVITQIDIEPTAGFVMSRRRIGDDWYLVVRQDRPSIEDLWFKCATLYDSDGLKAVIHGALTLPTNKIGTSRFEGREDGRFTAGDTQYDVYIGAGAAIAVITQKDVGDGFSAQATLVLSDGTEIELTGYRDGNDAVYCCPLTNEEHLLLANHTQETELIS